MKEILPEKESERYIEHIVNTYSDMVLRLALVRTKNYHNAQDIYSEVFLRLVSSLAGLKDEAHVKAWLIRVTINCTNTFFSSWWNKNTTEMPELPYYDSDVDPTIYDAVMTLPLKYRTVVHLFYYEGYTIPEISKMLNINAQTIKTHLSRARESLRQSLKGGETYEF